MSRSLTAQDRANLIRLASSLPAGSAERKAILAGLREPFRGGMPKMSSSIPSRFWNLDPNYDFSDLTDHHEGQRVFVWIKKQLGVGTYKLGRKSSLGGMARALAKMGFERKGKIVYETESDMDPIVDYYVWVDASGKKIVSWENEADNESYAVGVADKAKRQPPPASIAKTILRMIWEPGMGLLDTSRHSKPLAKIPATKYQSKFVALIKALIEEGFVFSPENIETIVHQEDDDAEE